MAEFECTVCGRCCMGMGRYVKVTGVMGPDKYAAIHGISNETFYPVVLKAFRGDFDIDKKKVEQGWCPFLMDADDEGKYYCAVHDTIPEFCRKYKCVSMRFYRSETIAGSLRGRTTLVSDDGALKSLWDNSVMPFPVDDYAAWKENLKKVLSDNGYTVEDYD